MNPLFPSMATVPVTAPLLVKDTFAVVTVAESRVLSVKTTILLPTEIWLDAWVGLVVTMEIGLE